MVKLWIRDTGGNAVTGAYMFNHFDFPISPARATEVYADKGMDGHNQKEARKTESGAQNRNGAPVATSYRTTTSLLDRDARGPDGAGFGTELLHI